MSRFILRLLAALTASCLAFAVLRVGIEVCFSADETFFTIDPKPLNRILFYIIWNVVTFFARFYFLAVPIVIAVDLLLQRFKVAVYVSVPVFMSVFVLFFLDENDLDWEFNLPEAIRHYEYVIRLVLHGLMGMVYAIVLHYTQRFKMLTTQAYFN